MSVSSSDDASDTFWPGYVDAVTNLAINLLFVIAVMAIVVISSIMQMAKMTETPASVAHEKLQAKNQEVSDTKKLAELEKQLATTQAALKEALAKSQSQSQSQKQSAAGATANSGENSQEEIIQASEKKVQSTGTNTLEASRKGIVVAFSADVVELSDKETSELLNKMGAIAPVKSSRWQVAVVSPKGFSEAIRLAYYRASAVRNALLKNGVPPNAIDMRVVESTSTAADNARVMVKLVQ